MSTPRRRPYDPTTDPLLVRWAAQRNLDLAEVAHQIGVPVEQFRAWLREHPDMAGAVAEGQRTADAHVVQALFKRATGYEFETSESTVVRGKSKEIKKFKLKKFQHHAPADVRAIIFWLKNRLPDQWRDRPPAHRPPEIIARIRPIPLLPAVSRRST